MEAAAAVVEDAEGAVAEVAINLTDRFGLGWRSELAPGILVHLDEIDIVEVIADDHFDATGVRARALKTLASQVPVTLHGVGIGPATTCGLEMKRVEDFARLIDRVKPDSWSEHLAWVRAGGVEIGHLAAPCRNESTVAATVENLARMTKVVGIPPVMENIATLINPPASPMSEGEWLNAVFRQSDCGLLLDLHNVYANSQNFQFPATKFLDSLPLERVRTIHLAGGKMWEGRLLDDHLHDVPPYVFSLLEHVASKASQPLTVLLERDGKYPRMESLLAELRAARSAVARGRERAARVVH